MEYNGRMFPPLRGLIYVFLVTLILSLTHSKQNPAVIMAAALGMAPSLFAARYFFARVRGIKEDKAMEWSLIGIVIILFSGIVSATVAADNPASSFSTVFPAGLTVIAVVLITSVSYYFNKSDCLTRSLVFLISLIDGLIIYYLPALL